MVQAAQVFLCLAGSPMQGLKVQHKGAAGQALRLLTCCSS